MKIETIPNLYLPASKQDPKLFIYDFKMSKDVVKSKVELSMHMFSFLQVGKKQVHFANTSVAVNDKQSLILKKGNWLWTEILDINNTYYCKLLFFSEKKLQEFVTKYLPDLHHETQETFFFVIENDSYIQGYLNSLSILDNINQQKEILDIKFEELMLYLLKKYKTSFEMFVLSLIRNEKTSFQKTVEQNVFSNLKVEEIAFLCNMSTSTFKRHFKSIYNASPGKWFQDKRLEEAKKLLEKEKLKPSEIYMNFGYNNLSNFSSAFKKKFGKSPKAFSKLQAGLD